MFKIDKRHKCFQILNIFCCTVKSVKYKVAVTSSSRSLHSYLLYYGCTEKKIIFELDKVGNTENLM